MPSSYINPKNQKTSSRRRWYTLIAVFLLIFIALFYSKLFSGDGFYDKAFYESISGIRLPKSTKVLESFDNGEFWTASSFRINKDSLLEFINTYNFKNESSTYKPRMFSENTFEMEKLGTFSKKYVYNSGIKGKNSWMYIIDPERNVLWAEIQYPDWGGD
jgi:hypothetical protein